MLKMLLEDAAGTIKLQMYSISERQASSEDPNTVLRPQGLSRAGSCGDSCPMLVRSPDAASLSSGRGDRVTRYLEICMFTCGCSEFFRCHWKKKRFAKKNPGKKGPVSNEDPCNSKTEKKKKTVYNLKKKGPLKKRPGMLKRVICATT